MMYKLLNFFNPYLLRIEFSSGYVWFDFRVPSSWDVPNYISDMTGFIDFGQDGDSKLLRFVVDFSENSMDEVENAIKEFINHNLELVRKHELFLASTEALKEIFNNSSLDKLSNIKIVFDGKDGEMVGEGDQQGQDGD